VVPLFGPIIKTKVGHISVFDAYGYVEGHDPWHFPKTSEGDKTGFPYLIIQTI
jgi:hypothetical protein